MAASLSVGVVEQAVKLVARWMVVNEDWFMDDLQVLSVG